MSVSDSVQSTMSRRSLLLAVCVSGLMVNASRAADEGLNRDVTAYLTSRAERAPR